jgi:Holliday junction resolvasome RuvABC endonuclease subunit
MITVLGFDPGPKNFGFSVCQYRSVAGFDKDTIQWRCLTAGIVQNPINDVKRIVEQVTTFANELDELVASYSPNYVIVERFMTRGLKGTAIEYISMMLGIIVDRLRVRGIEVLIVQAASWKVPFKRLHDLEAMYKYALCQTHEIDASLLTAYMASRVFKVKNFEFLTNPASIVKKVENVSKGKRHRKRRGDL